MKLHDLQPGQRFSFIDKHRGKVFRVIDRQPHVISYEDTATGEVRDAWSNRLTFRMEVELEQPSERFTPDEKKLLDAVFAEAYFNTESEQVRSALNKLYLKLTGLPGRRVVLPEESC